MDHVPGSTPGLEKCSAVLSSLQFLKYGIFSACKALYLASCCPFLEIQLSYHLFQDGFLASLVPRLGGEPVLHGPQRSLLSPVR